MNSLSRQSLFAMPNGFGSLLFTQLFSTISFAVLYAILVLYMKQQLHMSAQQANLITGVYFAYNFSLHLLSGYLGGRLFSYRGLVVTGLFFQLIGCLILSISTLQTLYWGLACMLIGTGTMVTCLNMLLSQLFHTTEIVKRETGFLWNYSGMNLGFILGFTLAGYYQLHVNYSMLFLITAANNILTLMILFLRWHYMSDKNTSYINSSNKFLRISFGLLIIFALIPTLNWLLKHTQVSDDLVLTVGALVAMALIVITMKHEGAARRKLFVFFILLLSAQIFWIVYQLAPMGLTLFAKNNVDRHLFGLIIAPAWIQNINSVSIIIGAPLLGLLFAWLKRKIKSPLLPLQYSFGLLISGIGLLILPIGIALSHHGYTAFGWLFFTYVLQAITELLISPIGYSMVGQLVPTQWQSLCMGATLLNAGVAAVLSSYFSNAALGKDVTSNPLITNPAYSHMFSQLGWWTLAIGVVLFLMMPLLNHLIKDGVVVLEK